MAWAAIALAAYSALSSANASKNASTANAQSYEYQAAVAANNAIIGKQAAAYDIQAGDQQAEIAAMKGTASLESAKAAYSAGNLSIASGSPNNVIRDIATFNKLDVLTIRNNASRSAWNDINQSLGYTAQSSFDAAAAKNATIAGNTAFAGSLLSGASSVADKWLTYNEKLKNTPAITNTLGGGMITDSIDTSGVT